MNPDIPSIDQLKELGLPAPISYAPQTWGWWVLLGILIGVALLMGARRYLEWKRNRYRREALVQLAELQSRSDQMSALRNLPELLKRVALSMPPNRNIPSVGASLLAKRPFHSPSSVTDRALSRAGSLPHGPGAATTQSWQVFLQQHSAQPLPADFSRQLAQLAYAPEDTLRAMTSEQRQQLFDTCKQWVEHHHVAA